MKHFNRWAWLAVPWFAACGGDSGDKGDVTEVSDGADGDVAEVSGDTDTGEPADTSKDDDGAIGSDGDDSGDAIEPIEASRVFAFRAAPGQAVSEGPFPNDGLLEDGHVKLAPLGEDDRFEHLAKPAILERTDGEIARRGGFGFASAAFFPMNAEPDLATFADAVKYVALSGPEAGAVFPGTAAWFAPAGYLAVTPAWGHYLVPGATYAIVVGFGPKTVDGVAIEPPLGFSVAIADEVATVTDEEAKTRAAFAPLRQWLAARDESAIIGTVFTTEATLPFLDELLRAIDATPPTSPQVNVRWDAEGAPVGASPVTGAALDEYFGVPGAPFETTPTAWSAGARTDAAKVPAGEGGLGVPYAGGAFHGDIGYVRNGTLILPSFNLLGHDDGKVEAAPIERDADGAPVARTRVAVPFTVFLCNDHLADGAPRADVPVPFAIFTHGGTALRSDALPFAVLNCQAGYATVALDLPFHGGRQELKYLPGEDLVVPVRADDENVYSGKRRGDEGFEPDGIGDNGGATTTVGGLFSLASDFDPEVIEANTITIAVEAYALSRYVRGADNALGAWLGITVDRDHLVMEGLSFGTSYTTAMLAGSDAASGVIQSVGSGAMLAQNLPMAPNNAILAGGILRTIFGLAATLDEVNRSAHTEPVIALLQWLVQRGDPAGYAPFVLRHRSDGHALHVAGTGDSWDETLFSPAQLGFNAAWGVPVFTHGAAWTLDPAIPGADTVVAAPYAAPIGGNLTIDGRVQTAAYFYNAAACHAQVVTPLCVSSYAPPYPPATPRAAPTVHRSPICAIQSPLVPFLEALRAGEVPELTPPAGDCTTLYGK